MSKSNPLISVIIPTYNRADVIERAINSAVTQTIDNIEIIVVDDASTDNTESIVTGISDPRIILKRHDVNRGGGAARNTGIEESKGEYIAFLDSDDMWYSRKLEKQLTCLNNHSKNWQAVYTDHEVFSSGQKSILSYLDAVLPDPDIDYPTEGGEDLIPTVLMRELNLGGSSSLLVTRKVVESIGGFDESFDRYQDLEFLIRVLKKVKLAFVDEVLFVKETSSPASPEHLIDAQKKLFKKFSSDIRKYESEGYDITGRHNSVLARTHLREGDPLKGILYVIRSNPLTYKEYFSFMLLGLRRLTDVVS